VQTTVATGPPSLLPEMEAANHHLRRMDQVVMKIVNLTRSESSGPMRFFQLASETSLAGGDRTACEEAILEMAGQETEVLQVSRRFSPGVQQGLDALNDIFTIRQEKPQQPGVCLKRHRTKRLPRHDAPRDRSVLIRERV